MNKLKTKIILFFTIIFFTFLLNKDLYAWINDVSCWEQETISEINLVKNWWFETYIEWNITKKWWKKLSRFIWKLNSIPEWKSENGNYKLWKDSEITTIEWKNFLELNDENTIFQEISTKNNKKYKLSFYNLWSDELEVKWNWKVIHKANIKDSWINNQYIVDWINWKSKLEFKNTKLNLSNLWGVLINATNECSIKNNENDCIFWTTAWLCIWEDDICSLKPIYTTEFSCDELYINKTKGKSKSKEKDTINSYVNWVINLNKINITLPDTSNKINCSEKVDWNTINSGDKNDYFRVKNWENAIINMGWWNDIFIYNVTYSNSELENSIINWWDWFDKLIIQNTNKDKFDIVWDCSISCKISLKNNFWNWWNWYKFDNITLKNIEKIDFSDSSILFVEDDNDEILYQTTLRLAIDDIKLNEITSWVASKIDLMTIINDLFKNTVTNNSCTYIFNSLENNVKNEIVQQILNWWSYETIASNFLNSISVSSKYNVVKNVTYDLIKTQITACNTQEEQILFYDEVYNQTINNIITCVLNNLNTQINKQVEVINYLRKNVDTCSLSWNTITLNFLNNYSIYK